MGYRKIVVNGKTVVDFSDKVSQDDVIKGRYFYNKKGDIEEGGVDPSGQILGTAKKFVITPGTTEFRVPHGNNYGEDYEYNYKPRFEYVFKNIDELYIPKSLTHIYPDSFVCGYGEGWEYDNYSDCSLKEIKFENFQDFLNANFVIPDDGNFCVNSYDEGHCYYLDYPTFGWTPWRLALKKPYKLLDGDDQIKYFKMPLINDGILPPGFFANLYIDTLELAEGYRIIERGAFAGCMINRLILPSSVTFCPLDSSEQVKEAVYPVEEYNWIFGETNASWLPDISQSVYNNSDSDGFVTQKSDISHLAGYFGMSMDLVIPESIKCIGYKAFFEYRGLNSVVIPDSVTSIDEAAFEYCSGLTSVKIGDGVITIANYAFYGCDSLTSVVIGKNVSSIGDRAFKYNYSNKKMNVYCTSETPPAIQSNTFDSSYINKIYVPTQAAVDAYKAATNWSALSSKIVQGVV